MKPIRTEIVLFIIFLIIGCSTNSSTTIEPGSNANDLNSGENQDLSSETDSIESLGLTKSPCIATFTENYGVTDSWGAPLFTAKIGDTYIVSRYYTFANAPKAELLYLIAEGPYGFEISLNEGESLPFNANCAIDSNSLNVGVFATTNIYTDVNGTNEVCTLNKGTVSEDPGFRVLFSEIDLINDYSMYLLLSNPFETECGVNDSLYIKVSSTQIFPNNKASIIPIQSFVIAQ